MDFIIPEEISAVADAVLALRRQVRMRSAELGFYNLLAPASLGGEEMGAVAAAVIYETLHEHIGPGRHLIHPVLLPSPSTNGLSPLLAHLDGTTEIQKRTIARRLLDGGLLL